MKVPQLTIAAKYSLYRILLSIKDLISSIVVHAKAQQKTIPAIINAKKVIVFLTNHILSPS
jgi:hypothetical protein